MATFFCHPTALVESDAIGEDTRIWAFVHVLKGAVIGRGCNIGDHCFIENGVTIGNEVVIKNSVALWQGITLRDHVFVGPHAAFTNDLYPRAKLFHADYARTLIGEGASIGANATLVCGIQVGQYAMIGAGSTVTRDVLAFALVFGNPARQHGWVCVCSRRLVFAARSNKTNPDAQCECGRVFEWAKDVVRERATTRAANNPDE